MFVVDIHEQTLAWCENNPHLTDLYPIVVGHEVCKKDKPPYCKRNLYYTLHYVKSGSGYVTNNSVTQLVEKGQCFIVRPDETLVYSPHPDDPWEYIWIGLSGKLTSKFDHLPTVFSFPYMLFNEIFDLINEPGLPEMLITANLYKMYALLFGEKDTSVPDVKSSHVKTILRFLDYNFMHDFSIEEIAKKHNLNRNYLSQIFKEQVGVTMQEYRLKKRLAEAYELLSKGNSVTETAVLVGYNDISVFSRAFKKFHGVAPGSVKRKEK